MVLARRLRERQLHRPADCARQLDRNRGCDAFHRLTRRLSWRERIERHVARLAVAGRESRRPKFHVTPANPRRRRCRLESQMLRRGGVIGRGQRTRAADGARIIAAAEPMLRVAAGKGLFEKVSRIHRRAWAGEYGVRGLHRPLRRPPCIRDHRQPAVARGDVDDTRHPADGVARIVLEPAARRRQPRRSEQ